YEAYLADGTKIREGLYLEDKKRGKWRIFRADASPLASFAYVQGVRHGAFGVFRPSGVPYITGNFYYGKINGPIKYYNKSGSIINDFEFNDSELYQDRSYKVARIPYLPMNSRLQIVIESDTVLIR
ncbi:MAG: hypothetical protein AAFQ68_16780, partial [Bacteroidota bacterium]